jgi:hypothetical protein
MYDLGAFVGALIITFLLSRLFRRVWRSRPDPARALFAAAATLFLAVLLGAFGFAEGGPPRFGYTLALYLPPVILWLIIDMVRGRKATAPPPG